MKPLLVIEHLSKTFPGQVALDDVALELQPGRTHALVGQNGSGKSTLIKILAGYHQPDAGYSAEVTDASGATQSLVLGDGKAAEAAGIRFVHQDLGLVDMLSSVENLALGVGYTTRHGHIAWKTDTRKAREALADLGFDDFPVELPVGALTASQKTAVALARALTNWRAGASLLVLDEPTASLPGDDVQRLFAAIRLLKERGVAILYVSHHLDEVFAIADDVTVFRDGTRITTEAVAGLDHERLIELMVGHRVQRATATAKRLGDRALIDLRGLHGGNVHGVDLVVYEGEVVGVAGINGSGREHIAPLVTGQIPTVAGDVVLNAQFIAPYAPREVLQAGSAFLAADRATQGIMPTMSVSDNLTICDVGRHSRGGRLRHKEERKEVHGWIDRLRVKTAGSHAPIGTLSGGNQQKVLFARGLRLKPSVLVLDEPTRGIDVSAKEEIHAIVDNAAAEGAAVLVTSTDTDELVRLSSRVVVLVGGRLVAELTGADITVENIERAQLEIRTIAHATTGTPIEDHA